MKKSIRLGALANLAELKEKEAIKSMVDVQNHRMLEEQKLKQLVDFRDQFLEYSQKNEQAGICGSRMLETRIFMDQVARAIQEQEQHICGLESQIRERSAVWNQSRHERSAFEKLIQKELRNQARRQEKRNQTETDDRCGRKQDTDSGT